MSEKIRPVRYCSWPDLSEYGLPYKDLAVADEADAIIENLERSLHIAHVALDVKEQLNEALRNNHDEQKAKIQKLREALLACVGLLKAFIGPDDELGQAHISMAKEALR